MGIETGHRVAGARGGAGVSRVPRVAGAVRLQAGERGHSALGQHVVAVSLQLWLDDGGAVSPQAL